MIRTVGGHFARWAAARRKLAFIVEHLKAGRTVYLCNYNRATKLTAKNIPQLRANSWGFEIQHGRQWLAYDSWSVRVEGGAA